MALTKVTEKVLSNNIAVSGIVTATNFKIGSNLNLHSTGLALGAGSTIGSVTGVTTYYGDGSQLTGVVQSDTPVGSSNASTTFYEIDDSVSISTTTTLARASSNPGVIYTKFSEVVVGTAPGTVELIVDDGEEFVVDALQLRINTKDV